MNEYPDTPEGRMARLDAQLEDFKRRKTATAEREKAERDARARDNASKARNEDAVGVGDEVKEAVDALLRNVKPMNAEAYRDYQFRTTVVEWMNAWSWPKRFRYEIGSDWNCKPQEHVFKKVAELFSGHGAIVALVGSRGCGKTTIAAQLAIEQAWRNVKAVETIPSGVRKSFCYRKLADLIATYKPLYAGFGSIDTETLIRRRDSLTTEVEFLVIDELHECDGVTMKDTLLTDILDRRYANKRDTILISNQTADEFQRATSDSILSRIDEHGMVISCVWSSWRGNPKAKSA